MFNFHGGGMTPAEQMLYTGMNRTADRHGFIVVYPKGINEDWNVGYGMSYRDGTDDIGFVDSLLSHIEKEHKIIENKVFATGLSRGGFFCHRIASELPHRFSAIASIGANLPDSVAVYHKPQNPISVLMVNGKVDQLVNYDGKKGGYFSAKDTYEFWKTNLFNIADAKPLHMDRKSVHGKSVTILESQSWDRNLTLITIEDGGHTWPGADDFNIGLPIGPTSKELDINEYMWNFFNKNQ
ncbi:polyhydroxybutyrate depolymerase [Chryseobacterium flavum]